MYFGHLDVALDLGKLELRRYTSGVSQSVGLLFGKPFIESVPMVRIDGRGRSEIVEVLAFIVAAVDLGRIRLFTSRDDVTICRNIVPRYVVRWTDEISAPFHVFAPCVTGETYGEESDGRYLSTLLSTDRRTRGQAVETTRGPSGEPVNQS